MRPMAMMTLALLAATIPNAVVAQRFFARQTLQLPKSAMPSSPVGVASCGALVRGDWFVDNQYDTGLKAATLAEAQSACDSMAVKGEGTCGWTNDTFYPASFRNKVYWTKMVATRQYNIPSNTEGFVWAVACPTR
jgi:hypothetical protein